jgi:hypothetical protein
VYNPRYIRDNPLPDSLSRAAFRAPRRSEDPVIGAPIAGAALRRWYVVVVGMLLVGLCYAGFAHQSTTYQSLSTVVFVSPGTAPITGVDQVQTTSLVAFASTIENQMNDGQPVDRLASSSATIFGVGEHKGYQVAVPNQGGQWNYYFPNPVLSIQIVGPTAAWVEQKQTALVDRINRFTLADQQKLGVPASRMITAKLTTPAEHPTNVSATRNMRIRGIAALLVVGLIVSLSAATWLDRRLGGPRPTKSSSRSRAFARLPLTPSAPLWKRSES